MFQSRIAAHRLFFALRPPLRQARQIEQAAPWFAQAGRPVAADRLHLNLFILDDFISVPMLVKEALERIGSAVAAAIQPVPVVLDSVSGGARSIALRPQHKIAPLEALVRALIAEAAALGIAGREDFRFSAHMTLGYRDGRPFSQRVAPVAWTADELLLIHSHLGKARHDVIGRWPLAGPAEEQLALL